MTIKRIRVRSPSIKNSYGSDQKWTGSTTVVNRNEPHVYVRVFYGSGTGAVKKIFLYEVLRGQVVFDRIRALASESAPGL